MLNLLIVDDEMIEIEALKKLLLEIKLEVNIIGEAHDGETAVKLARELVPDMIFMDVKMPRLYGTDAARIIKEKNKNVTIYLMCTNPEQIVDMDYIDGTMTKPIRRKTVQSIISNYKKNHGDLLFSKGGLFEKLLKEIHLENYRQAKRELDKLYEQLMTMRSEKHMFQKNVSVICEGMLTICDVKGIGPFISNSHWKKETDTKKMLDTLLKEIFTVIIEHSTSSNEIQTILNYIELHYMKGITLEEVAEFIHLTPNYVSRLFKKEAKTTFINYVTERKIEHAKHLLEHTDMPVVNIALKLSFQEHTYFSKVFKKNVSLTPTEYRNQFRKETTRLSNTFNSKVSKNWTI